MEKTIIMAKENEICVGAHPGFLDLMGFGRRKMDISQDEARAYVTYQIGALYGFLRSYGMELCHVKPHGALYNMAADDYELSRAICEAVYNFDKNLIMLARSNSQMIKAAEDIGLRCASEVFADRAYEDDGSLVSRKKEGSMITDENLAIERVIRMVKEGKVETITGKDISIKADSVCVHGDGPKALAFVEKIRKRLTDENIKICSLKKFL